MCGTPPSLPLNKKEKLLTYQQISTEHTLYVTYKHLN